MYNWEILAGLSLGDGEVLKLIKSLTSITALKSLLNGSPEFPGGQVRPLKAP